MPEQEQQQRMPNLDPQLYALLNEIDGFVSKAALTRAEHAQSGNVMQALVRRLEQDRLQIAELKAKVLEQEKQLSSAAATEAVTAALKK